MSVEKSDKISSIASKPLRILSDYEISMSKLLGLIARETSFESTPPLKDVLEMNHRMIVVFSHSSPLSWIPAPCLLANEIMKAGGGERTPIAVMDRFFYKVPLLKSLAKFISQSERPLSFRELIQHFKDLKTADLIVFPEGSNCFFGAPDELQNFRSNRFVEIAIETKTPLLVCVHRGSENWGKALSFKNEWIEKIFRPLKGLIGSRLRTSETLTIPILPRPMPQYSMRCELYRCESEDISLESEKVREKMKRMLAKLDSELNDSAL